MNALIEEFIASLNNIKEIITDDFELFHYYPGQYHRWIETFKFMNIPSKDIKILELGCFPGHFAITLRRMGLDVKGLDLKRELELKKELYDTESIEVKECDISKEKFPFEDDTFDYVIFTEVLEHLIYDPHFTVNESYRVLKHKGTLILGTPNIARIGNRYSLLLGRNILTPAEKFYGFPINYRHNREYTTDEAVNLLIDCKFTIEKIKYFIHWERLYETPEGYFIPVPKKFSFGYLKHLAELGLAYLIPKFRSTFLIKGVKLQIE